MPTPADFRAQIALQIRAEGKDEAQSIIQEMDRIKGQMEGLKKIFNEGSIGIRDYLTTLKDMEREYVAFGGQLNTVQAALAEQEAVLARTQAIHDRVTQVRRVEMSQGDFYTRMMQGINREQEHLNDLIAEGAQMEAAATRTRIIDVGAYTESLKKTQTVLRETGAIQTTAQKMLPEWLVGSKAVNAQMNQGASSAQKFGYGILNISHALQDAQYGFGAVLNNIPLVVQAFGGGAGVAGAVMAAGVAFELLRGHVGDIKVALGFAIDTTQAFALTVGDLEAKLKTLTEKSWKTSVDYSEIEKAEEALRRLREGEALWEAHRKTKPEKELGEQAQAVVEQFGGAGAMADVVQGAALAGGRTFAKQSDVDVEKRLRETVLPNLQKQLAQAPWFQQFGLQQTIKKYESDLLAVQDTIAKANIAFSTGQVKDFMAGKPAAIGFMKGLAEKQPGAFTPEALTGIQGLAASPEALKARQEEEKRIEEESSASEIALEESIRLMREARQGRKQKAGVRAGEVSGHAAKFQADKALGDMLGDVIEGLIAGGMKDPEALKAAVGKDVETRIKATKIVPEGMIAEVAAKIIATVLEKQLAGKAGQLAPGAVDIQVPAAANIAAAAKDAADKAQKARDAAARKAEAADRKAEAAEKKGFKEEVAGSRAQFAGQLQEQFGTDHFQSLAGAKHFEGLINQGVNRNAALQDTAAMMQKFFVQNMINEATMNGILGEMQGEIGMAIQQQQMMAAQAQMLRGQMGQNAVRRGFNMQAIPMN